MTDPPSTSNPQPRPPSHSGKKPETTTLAKIAEGQMRPGTVESIVDFGAFVDLGGVDGLLHITDMAWDRASHPSEIVSVGEDVEVVVLKVDRER